MFLFWLKSRIYILLRWILFRNIFKKHGGGGWWGQLRPAKTGQGHTKKKNLKGKRTPALEISCYWVTWACFIKKKKRKPTCINCYDTTKLPVVLKVFFFFSSMRWWGFALSENNTLSQKFAKNHEENQFVVFLDEDKSKYLYTLLNTQEDLTFSWAW